MEKGYIDKFDIKRITSAVEEDFVIEQIEKGKYAVRNKSSDDTHVANLKTLECTCPDYEYNCQPKEAELGDKKYCKHLFHSIFSVHGMV